MVNKFSKLFRKIRFPHNFSNSVTIEFWVRYSLLQKFPQANIIFFHHPTVSVLKLRPRPTKFMIIIALPKELGSKICRMFLKRYKFFLVSMS